MTRFPAGAEAGDADVLRTGDADVLRTGGADVLRSPHRAGPGTPAPHPSGARRPRGPQAPG
ncbi:hypothetical protein, partial [Streptomyces hygroscopicus]|uniref:hypothetical protein n=1 Tax=Streptomyces hygroscopicus TaxID=1912 RepID=UPI00367A739A